MTDTSRMLVIGLPSAGKTTFIAALWHVVSTEEVPGALVLAELQPDRSHLNGIAKLWRECKTIPRTTIPKERTVTMNLKTSSHETVYKISIPDSSGEAFKRIFEQRRWSPEIAALAHEADSLLFFLHPSSLAGTSRIDANIEEMVETAAQELDPLRNDDDVNKAHVIPSTKVSPQPWLSSLASQQAKLLDLLQLVRNVRPDTEFRTAVIISAWDIVKVEMIQPSRWIEKRAPLLHQYLESHRKQFPYEVFGVSAQGADLSACESLRNFVHPSDRIEIAHGSESSHDITLPIRWILE